GTAPGTGARRGHRDRPGAARRVGVPVPARRRGRDAGRDPAPGPGLVRTARCAVTGDRQRPDGRDGTTALDTTARSGRPVTPGRWPEPGQRRTDVRPVRRAGPMTTLK